MAESLPVASPTRWRRGTGFVLRTAWRTIVESLYLLTAPAIAFVGLLLVLGGLCLSAVGLLRPRKPRPAAAALTPARWFADLERWRIATVRSLAAKAIAGGRPRPKEIEASDPGLWLDVTHAVAVFPLAVVTAIITGIWWFVALGGATSILRDPSPPPGPLQPATLYVGSARTHIDITLGLSSPSARHAFGTAVGLLLLLSLPLLTRAFVAAQAGLGQALLWDESALHRRISGLEQERDTARAQTVAAVTAEAAALRRLERDIHDGPQQRLVRLAMELGRAERHLETKPEAARAALADALTQAQEALEELRALSRGIAPPILTDRGLPAALTALAGRSTVPAELETEPLSQRLDAATETAAYFVVAEALANVAKHSHARRCAIGLNHTDGTLKAWVTDDGIGGAALDKGHGLRGLDERLRAIGGHLHVTSPTGGPTTITAELPCR